MLECSYVLKVDENVYIDYNPTNKTICRIGYNAKIRTGSVIYSSVTIGDHFHLGHNGIIREKNKIGNNVSIGSNTAIEPGCIIGNNTRIHGGCFVVRAVIGEGVFIGPNTTFTDDPHPACPKYLECKPPINIADYASIGANVTLLPGVSIGKGALIGAGAVVTEDVPDFEVWAGNPAKFVKKIDELHCKPGHYEQPFQWKDGGYLLGDYSK